MKDWNVVVTVFDEVGYRAALRRLPSLGQIDRTGYFNVLVMKVADIAAFTEELTRQVEADPGILNDISRVVPAHETFDFVSAEDFTDQARHIVLGWCAKVAGGSFYVRLHRRGLRGRIVSPEQERIFDEAILERTEAQGRPARIDFADPDHVIDIETVGNRAGLSIWTRDEHARIDFLHID